MRQMDLQHRVPLFINRFSLSPRTAIGVQTLRLLSPHEDWLHFHWCTNSLKQLDERSLLLENTLLGRFSFLHNPRFMGLCERMGVTDWRGSVLRPSLAHQLRSEFGERVSSAYLAPLNESDATRCLELVNLMEAPFVLHLWDVLQGDIAQGALRELIDRAKRVFCVSEPLLRDVRPLCRDAELLSFSRDAAEYRALAPEGTPLKVVMHGNVSSYEEGLDHLDQAIALVECKGVEVEVCFLGSPKILRQAGTALKPRVKVLGFCATQQDVDRELSRAHVAFLPGPSQDPRYDLRSRYSIPSRILDYMAVGLPMVGSIHKDSATASFVGSSGLDPTVGCGTPEEIAGWLSRLAQKDVWAEQSARSQNAFDCLQRQESPAQKLKRTLERIV